MPTMDYADRFIGGRGIAAKIYWDEVSPEVSAFDPENRLIFATGPLAGLSGAMLAHTLPLFKPLDFNFFKSVDVLLMVVLGGMGSITGSYVGAILITIIPEALRFLGQWRLVIYSLILVLFMIFRPGGLLGTAEIGELIRRKALRGLRRLTGEERDTPDTEGADA